tara:strand:+ start:76438 stop:77481 length:1044 start_codon:yes stop_codon:yes gene_type:complete
MKFKHKTIAALFSVLFFGLQVFAGGLEEYKKQYHESFKVNSDVVLTVENKFGFVKIVTSETDHIIIDVTVKVEAKNQEKAQKLLDKIEIELEGNASNVSAITTIVKNANFKELAIDYTITMPVSGNVDITNKFGSLYLNELNGNSKLYVAYGSLDIGSLNSQENNITVKFGSGKVKYAQYLDYTTRYSAATIKRAKLLNMDNQYGAVTVGEVGRMSLTNAYGDVELGTIVELTIHTRFGDVDVEGVISSLDLDTQYGDVDIDFISKDFETVIVDASFGDVDLAFQSGSNFTLESKASFGDINIPSGTIKQVDGSGNTDTYNGKMFEGSSQSKVKVKMSYGDLDISIH